MTLGPVTQTLEREVASELRRQGILIWLDKDEHYRTFVDGLSTRATAGVFPHPVVSFRGSFLELLLTLEPFGSGLDKAPLLIHQRRITVDDRPWRQTWQASAQGAAAYRVGHAQEGVLERDP